MGEAKRRKAQDPLYGFVSNTEKAPPHWYVHRGALILLGGDNNLTLISGNNKLPDLNEDEVEELNRILDANPQLLPSPTTPLGNDIDTQTISLL